MSRKAVFLDRDGTLIHPIPYPSCPEQIHLYEHIGPDLYALQEQGFALVMITNQAGIARGYFRATDLELMHATLAEQLAVYHVALTATYYCPHHPEGRIPELAIHCTCRKPQPGMILQAAADLDIDLVHSWFVGDILHDVEAGNRAGCHTILVDLGTESWPTTPERAPHFVARDTQHALRIIHALEEAHAEPDLLYRPVTWCHPLPMLEVNACNSQR